MPLTYLLYRCPRCGHDPLEGSGDEAACAGCGVHFSRGGEGGLIRVEEPSGESWEVQGHRLTAAMASFPSGQEAFGKSASGPIRSAEVRVRQSGEESPVRWGGELLGFAEAMGETRVGILEISGRALTLRPNPRGEEGPQRSAGWKTWDLLDIRAVQTSSSCLQFSPSTGGLLEFRFPNDSPYRWETLLRDALRKAYRREGLGEIVEFQPRVVAE